MIRGSSLAGLFGCCGIITFICLRRRSNIEKNFGKNFQLLTHEKLHHCPQVTLSFNSLSCDILGNNFFFVLIVKNRSSKKGKAKSFEGPHRGGLTRPSPGYHGTLWSRKNYFYWYHCSKKTNWIFLTLRNLWLESMDREEFLEEKEKDSQLLPN